MLSSLMRPSPLTFFRAASSLSDSDSNMGAQWEAEAGASRGLADPRGSGRGSGAEPRGRGAFRVDGSAGPRIGFRTGGPKATAAARPRDGDRAKKSTRGPAHRRARTRALLDCFCEVCFLV